jgi:hypothetical protein
MDRALRVGGGQAGKVMSGYSIFDGPWGAEAKFGSR